jgi:hypothetical protein
MWQLLVQLRERLQLERAKSTMVSPQAGYIAQNVDASVPSFSNDLMLEFDMTSMQPGAMICEDQFSL